MITIEFTGSTDLTVREVWPDDDAPDSLNADHPEDITARHVMEAIGRLSPSQLAHDWGLQLGFVVTVSRRNPIAGLEDLFGNVAPDFIVTTESSKP